MGRSRNQIRAVRVVEMPLYDYYCEPCNVREEHFFKLEELRKGAYVTCPSCRCEMIRELSPVRGKVFKEQRLDITYKGDGEKVRTVSSMHEVKEHIKRFNDTEEAAIHGKVAILE